MNTWEQHHRTSELDLFLFGLQVHISNCTICGHIQTQHPNITMFTNPETIGLKGFGGGRKQENTKLQTKHSQTNPTWQNEHVLQLLVAEVANAFEIDQCSSLLDWNWGFFAIAFVSNCVSNVGDVHVLNNCEVDLQREWKTQGWPQSVASWSFPDSLIFASDVLHVAEFDPCSSFWVVWPTESFDHQT